MVLKFRYSLYIYFNPAVSEDWTVYKKERPQTFRDSSSQNYILPDSLPTWLLNRGVTRKRECSILYYIKSCSHTIDFQFLNQFLHLYDDVSTCVFKEMGKWCFSICFTLPTVVKVTLQLRINRFVNCRSCFVS